MNIDLSLFLYNYHDKGLNGASKRNQFLFEEYEIVIEEEPKKEKTKKEDDKFNIGMFSSYHFLL